MTEDNRVQENESKEPTLSEADQEPAYPPLKDLLVQYTGAIVKPADNSVTLPMIIDTLADHFPELVMTLAKENFIRGYNQALQDVEVVQQIPEKPAEECDIETDVIDAEFEIMPKEEEKTEEETD